MLDQKGISRSNKRRNIPRRRPIDQPGRNNQSSSAHRKHNNKSENKQNEWESRAEEIRSEIKRACIEIESKGLAECRQTDITSHEMRMKDTKPIKHKIRLVPYHCRKEFEQIIKDQLAAGIIQPSKAATCIPVNLVLKEEGSLRLTIDYRKINNATEPDPYPLPRIDDIIARLANNKVFSKIDLGENAPGVYKVYNLYKRIRQIRVFSNADGSKERRLHIPKNDGQCTRGINR